MGGIGTQGQDSSENPPQEYEALKKYADELRSNLRPVIQILQDYIWNKREIFEKECKHIDTLLIDLSKEQKLELVEKIKTDMYSKIEKSTESWLLDKVNKKEN